KSIFFQTSKIVKRKDMRGAIKNVETQCIASLQCKIFFGIYFFVVFQDLVVEMRPCTASCAAHESYDIACGHLFTFSYQRFGQVSVACLVVVGMFDLDDVAVISFIAGKHDCSLCRSLDPVTGPALEVYS